MRRDQVFFAPVLGPGILPAGTLKLRLGFSADYADGVVRPDYLRNFYGGVDGVPPRGAPLYASAIDAGLGRDPIATSNGDSIGVGPPPGLFGVPPWRNE